MRTGKGVEGGKLKQVKQSFSVVKASSKPKAAKKKAATSTSTKTKSSKAKTASSTKRKAPAAASHKKKASVSHKKKTTGRQPQLGSKAAHGQRKAPAKRVTAATQKGGKKAKASTTAAA